MSKIQFVYGSEDSKKKEMIGLSIVETGLITLLIKLLKFVEQKIILKLFVMELES